MALGAKPPDVVGISASFYFSDFFSLLTFVSSPSFWYSFIYSEILIKSSRLLLEVGVLALQHSSLFS